MLKLSNEGSFEPAQKKDGRIQDEISDGRKLIRKIATDCIHKTVHLRLKAFDALAILPLEVSSMTRATDNDEQ